jgi:SP family sugar porter-like MFS transporter
MAVATASLWSASFLLTYTFPLLNASAGTEPTFWLCAPICVASLTFIGAHLRETKGKTLQEIERD